MFGSTIYSFNKTTVFPQIEARASISFSRFLPRPLNEAGLYEFLSVRRCTIIIIHKSNQPAFRGSAWQLAKDYQYVVSRSKRNNA